MVREDDHLPVGAVAAKTLRRRLDGVWSDLQAACGSPATAAVESERVHQLRVATRRALAALEAFGAVLPTKRRSWFEKRLVKLRRAAGEARDLDVLSERLSRPDKAAALARRRLVAMLSKQRSASRAPIHEIHERLLEEDWPGRVDRLVEDVDRRRHQPAFGAYARRRFKPMIVEFFAAAGRRLRNASEMHALRIQGKKLRYALEIFASVLPDKSGAKCRVSLEQLQHSLGEFTDHAAAADRFARWARSADAGSNRDLLAKLRREETAKADVARRNFSRWWDEDRRRALRRRLERAVKRRSA
jgi:CHAD domain-containing protein